MPISIHCSAAACSLYIGANEEIRKPFICSARSFRGEDFSCREGPFVDRPQARARGRGDHGGGEGNAAEVAIAQSSAPGWWKIAAGARGCRGYAGCGRTRYLCDRWL